MELAQFVDGLDLNRYEKEVIFFLSSVDHGDAHTIYQATHVPKGRIYSVLNSLMEKGFVQVIPTSPKRYKMEDVKESLQHYLTRKKNQLDEQLQQAKRVEIGPKRFSLQKNAPSVYSFTGREEHLNALVSLRDRTRKKILQVAPLFVGTFASNLSIYQALRRGVQMQIIIQKVTLENKKNVRECLRLGADIRQLNAADLLSFMLRDRDEFILGVEDYRNQEERLSLISRNKGLLLALEHHFKSLWKQARKIEKV